MPESEDRGIIAMRSVAANDNPGSRIAVRDRSGAPGSVPGQAGAGGGAEARIDTAVMTLARLIGRRIAREEYERLDAANDNAPGKDAGER